MNGRANDNKTVNPLPLRRYYSQNYATTSTQHSSMSPQTMRFFSPPPTPYANVPYFLDGLGRDTCKEEIFAFYFTYSVRSGKHRLSLSLSSGGGGSDGWRRRVVITFFLLYSPHRNTRPNRQITRKRKKFFCLLSDQTDLLRVHAMTAH